MAFWVGGFFGGFLTLFVLRLANKHILREITVINESPFHDLALVQPWKLGVKWLGGGSQLFFAVFLHSVWISFRKQPPWRKTVCHSLSLTIKTEGKEPRRKSAVTWLVIPPLLPFSSLRRAVPAGAWLQIHHAEHLYCSRLKCIFGKLTSLTVLPKRQNTR